MAFGTVADRPALMSCYCQSTVAHPELPQRNKGYNSHHREAWMGRCCVATGRTEVSVPCAGARLHRVGRGHGSTDPDLSPGSG